MTETTPILTRDAAQLYDSDRYAMARLLEAMETVLGVNYMEALQRWESAQGQGDRTATVGEVLARAGLNPGERSQVATLAAMVEANADQERQKLGEAAPLAENDRIYAGQALEVPEAVFLPNDFDHGVMANPEERARRLATARANDQGGKYVGDQGAERFHNEDKKAVELGLDLPRSMARATEIARARAIAKNETGGVAQAINATRDARLKRRALETEIRELDRRVEAEDAERVDLKRRKVARAGLAPNSGALLALRHEATKQLDRVNQSRCINLESIPNFGVGQASSPVKLLDGKVRAVPQALRKPLTDLQRQIDTAGAYLMESPGADFVTALGMAERGEIALAADAPNEEAIDGAREVEERLELHRNTKQYLLDNGLPEDDYAEVSLLIAEGKD